MRLCCPWAGALFPSVLAWACHVRRLVQWPAALSRIVCWKCRHLMIRKLTNCSFHFRSCAESGVLPVTLPLSMQCQATFSPWSCSGRSRDFRKHASPGKPWSQVRRATHLRQRRCTIHARFVRDECELACQRCVTPYLPRREPGQFQTGTRAKAFNASVLNAVHGCMSGARHRAKCCLR